jgi:hypothetical protein
VTWSTDGYGIRSARSVFLTATQYYAAARFAVLAGLNPVLGNLFHHAIEMYIKGHLSESMSLSDLRKFGHNVVKLWNEFKASVNDPALDRFDGLIGAVAAFEELRYPDSVLANGMSSRVLFRRSTEPLPRIETPKGMPKYEICVEEIDELIAAIFKAAQVNPTFFAGRVNTTGREYLTQENTSGLDWSI